MKVRLNRTKDWIYQERLKRGENVAPDMDAEVNPADLSEEARRVALDCGGGKYPDMIKFIPHGPYYSIIPSYHCGTELFLNGYEHSPEDIGRAILAAHSVVRSKRQERLAKENARKEKWRLEKEEEERKERLRNDARQVIKDELENLNKKLKDALADRSKLSKFLSRVPLDALRGTCKRIAADDSKTAEDVEKEVEEASSCWIFPNREDEENDEDED